MKRALTAAIIMVFASALPARAEFIGKLEFKPAGCKSAGQCELVFDFGYIEPGGYGWQAKAGLKTDGASIPSWAQPIIGGAWDAEYIRAAVIHDHYCIRTVRPRTATHRMFYNALIESGVDRPKALVMYYAVMVGSHMWINLHGRTALCRHEQLRSRGTRRNCDCDPELNHSIQPDRRTSGLPRTEV